jgi:hypothetical protein
MARIQDRDMSMLQRAAPGSGGEPSMVDRTNMTKRKLLIWIPVVAILLNFGIYLLVSNARGPAKPADCAPAPPAAAPRAQGAQGSQGSNDGQRRSGGKFRDSEQDKEERALARRSAGLAALDAGDYERALIDLTEARSLMGERANVDELLRVTEDLRGHQHPSPRAHVAPPPSPSPVVPRFGARPAMAHRFSPKPEPVVESAPVAPAPPAPPPSGLIIVSTTPRGLLVHVDDAAVDLTPMRTRVKPGAHRVALFDGDRKVYEAALEVKEGGTSTLLKDLSLEHGPDSSPREAPAPVTPAVPFAKDESPSPRPAAAGSVVAVATSAPATTRRPASPPLAVLRPPMPAPDTGALQITSPGLYGVVWVNGRPRGYPPLEVGDLGRGPAKVEVRVNGIERRGTTVVVAPGRITPVSLR